MKLSIKTLFFLALIVISCKTKSKYDLFAEDLCTCMKPMAELQKKLMALTESGDQAGMMSLFDEASKVDEEGQACIMALEKKHGVIQGPEEEAKAEEAMRKACPARFFVFKVLFFNTFAPEISCLGARPSQEQKCFSLGNLLISVPTSMSTVWARDTPNPSTTLKSTPLSRFRCWRRAS